MATLLHLDTSVRSERSLSRRLSAAFVDTWLRERPTDKVLRRDLAAETPPFVDEAWIAASFTPEAQRSAAMIDHLSVSDTYIEEVEAADVLIIATPMFNYGMPARLKAWIDQIVRVERTFSFDLRRGDWPLEPVFMGKALVMLTSAGEFGFGPGEPREQMNHLDTHLRIATRYLGVERSFHLGLEYQEFGDDRHARSVADAYEQLPELVASVASFIDKPRGGNRQ